jgi:hypothetical protein
MSHGGVLAYMVSKSSGDLDGGPAGLSGRCVLSMAGLLICDAALLLRRGSVDQSTFKIQGWETPRLAVWYARR